jgi:hypothetical protein
MHRVFFKILSLAASYDELVGIQKVERKAEQKSPFFKSRFPVFGEFQILNFEHLGAFTIGGHIPASSIPVGLHNRLLEFCASLNFLL